MKIVFLDAGSLGPDVNLSDFSKRGEVTIWEATSKTERIPRLQGFTVAVANRIAFDQAVFSACRQLRLVLLMATGFNHVDLEAARRHGVAVCNVVGYSTESVAQHTLTLLLTLMEQSPWLNGYARSIWPGSTAFGQFGRPFREIAGKNWGIVGLGRIGERVAELAAAFGARPSYFSSTGTNRSALWPRLELQALLSSSDIVTVHSPLTEFTKGLLGREELSCMKPSAYLVNTGRGGIIDEAALARALDNGTLAGAALDVTLPEPPDPGNPLLALGHPERLVLSPHVAWASVESRERCLQEVGLNLQSWLDGQRRNRLD